MALNFHIVKNKKFIFTAIAIIVAGGLFSFFYYRDTIFSKQIVRLEILGPENAKIGDEIEYTIKYKNNGNFALEDPKLVFELPDNSLTEDSKLRITKDLGDIYPGDQDFVKFQVRLLGKEGDLKFAHAWLSYKPKNLSVRYESDTTFTTKIDTSPITLSFDSPSRVEKGKEVSLVINYFSNIDYPLENLSVKVDSVSGFSIKSSDPDSLDNIEWKLKTLQKGQGGRITIKGVITGDTGNHLNFSAKLGMWQRGAFVVIKEANQDVEVIQAQLFMSQQINGSSSYIASPGQTLHYELFFRNIGSTPFDNLFIVSRLSGSAFDLSSLQSPQGQLRPNDNLIVFDPKQIPSLAHVASQQEVKVDFTVKLKDSWVPQDSEKNTTVIKNTVTVSDINQEFVTKVSTKLELVTTLGSGENGATSVTWQVKNYFNDAKNVKVKAILPPGVSLNDQLSPEDQASHFSFDSKSREIVWQVGDVPAGAGVSGSGPTLTFQVSGGNPLNPVGQATISGEDQFTGANI